MTIRNAIKMAKIAIKSNDEYLKQIRQYDQEHPDISEQKIGSRMTNLVIAIVENENQLLCDIISQIQPKKKLDYKTK